MPEGQAFPVLCKHAIEVLHLHRMAQELHLKLVRVVLHIVFLNNGDLSVEVEVHIQLIPDLQVAHALMQVAAIRRGGLP